MAVEMVKWGRIKIYWWNWARKLGTRIDSFTGFRLQW